MLPTMAICIITWVALRRRPPLVRASVVAVALLASVLTAWTSISVLISRQPVGPNQEVTFFAPTSFPLSMVGYHDFAARQFNYRMVLGWPDGWTLWGGQLTDDQSEFMKLQRYEMAALFAITSFAAASLTILALVAANYVGPLLFPKSSTPTGKSAAEPKKPSRRLNLVKMRHSPWPERLVLASGLALLLVGSICILVPAPAVIALDEAVFQMAGPPPSQGILSIQLSPAQTARIVVEFDRNATARREVELWANYGEEVRQIGSYVNQSDVVLLLFWGNFSLPAMFIIGFTVAAYYYGNNSVLAAISVTRYQNSLATPGLLMVGLAALPLWSFLIMTWVRHREQRLLYNLDIQEMTEG